MGRDSNLPLAPVDEARIESCLSRNLEQTSLRIGAHPLHSGQDLCTDLLRLRSKENPRIHFLELGLDWKAWRLPRCRTSDPSI